MSEPPEVARRAMTHARDWLSLTKPRIALMVSVTAVAGYHLADPTAGAGVAGLLALGTLLSAAGASALNMVQERERDGRMARTAGRPIPAGRVAARSAAVFGMTLSASGLGVLALGAGLVPAALALATSVAYLGVYTPLKALTPASTIVGAAPGALPVLMGWTAAGRPLDGEAWTLFAILFLWQLPHFLAIAWVYRADYAAGGCPMLPVLDQSGASTGRQVVLQTLALLAASLAPVGSGMAGPLYFYGAAALGCGLLAFGVLFALARSTASARRLYIASITYLPVLLALLALGRTPH
ncbi:MAG: protoheme IX farnesyltransferase [Planctomycetes bacterium]|nr:protoheme IX farnesyltransferase [Planctomycetota bacterium]